MRHVLRATGRAALWAVGIAHWAYEWALKQGIGTSFTLSGD